MQEAYDNGLRAKLLLYDSDNREIGRIDISPRKARTAVLSVEVPDVDGPKLVPVSFVQSYGQYQYFVCCVSEPNFPEVMGSIGSEFRISLDSVYVPSVAPSFEEKQHE